MRMMPKKFLGLASGIRLLLSAITHGPRDLAVISAVKSIDLRDTKYGQKETAL
jgi:hypothetical protein